MIFATGGLDCNIATNRKEEVMKGRNIFALPLIAMTLTVSFFASPARSATIYAVTTSSALISFDSATPGSIISSLPLSRFQPSESFYGIDFRPATGQLYALAAIQTSDTRTGQIYTINPATGAATDLPGAATSFD